MPVNLELKASHPSLSQAEECARAHGADFLEDLRQTDTYFLLPRGRLKLREIEGKPSELIYYDRLESTPERWSTYIRQQMPSGSGLKTLLTAALGVRTVVKKERRVFLYRGARIHLDRVEGLGTFLEFEVPAGKDGGEESLMRELRALFGIEERAIVALSYADMSERTAGRE